MRILFFLFLSSQAFSEEIIDLPYSAPDQIVALTKELGKIGRIVSPLSGQPCLRQIDLIAKGAQDVILKRVFISQYRDWHANYALLICKGLIPHEPVVESGWVVFPHTHLDLLVVTKRKHHKTEILKNEVRIVDQNGAALTFALELNGQTKLVDKPYGICNSNSFDEMPSGQYDHRNTRIIRNKGSIDVHSPEGSIYHYRQPSVNVFNDQDQHVEVYKAHYLLSKEVLPCGKVLRYQYNKERELIRIESMDPQERHVYAYLNIDSSSYQATSNFSTNSGISAFYKQNTSKKNQSKKLQECAKALNLLSINSANTPFYPNETISLDKSLLGSYSGRRNLFSCEYSESGERHSKGKRVNKLLFSENNAQFQAIHEFAYDPPLIGEKAGNTCVKNMDGSYVTYEYSAQLLLTAIKHFDAHAILKKKKEFYWTDNHWLSGLAVHDGEGYLLYKKNYQYDAYGNPKLETFCGDIAGSGVYENVLTTRQFSDDNRHLLLEEKNDEGKAVSFQYLPNTDLPLTKITKQRDLILLREFYDYDDCNNLIKKIEDNGSTKDRKNLLDVTQRKITNYILRNQQPFLHLTEWIEEKYLENGFEKILKRIHFSYDGHGNVCEERIYDADGFLSYTLYKSYDERGYLISESNAIGQQATYGYDDKGRRIFSTNLSKTLQTKMDYDQRDRLIKIEETGIDQIVHSTAFSYDLNDNLTSKIDPFQNVTVYSYDPLCHKVKKTSSPPIVGQDGKITPVITSSIYDSFGRELSKIDANGNITTYRYTGHHLPVEIIHPDASKESFSYTRTGLLKNHVDPEGLKTSYSYDALNRLILKSYAIPNEEVAKESFVYNSFNLIEKTDREGNKTSYSYDGAGRLITEDASGKVINYSYDTLGRLLTIVNCNGKNSLFTHYKRDLLDRIIEKQCGDADGQILTKIAYHYDVDGNVSAIIRNINGKEAIETFSYDSFQRQTQFTDALGNETKTIYNENASNSLGQKVLQVIRIDAKNRSFIKTEDPFGREVQEDVVDSDNELITSQKMAYDPNGNLIQKKNLIFQNGKYQRTLETKYNYTQCNQVNSLIRAANTPNSRLTQYSYTTGGKVAKKTKPDGTGISYTYHPLGQLKTISSDDMLKLSYDYNLIGDLIKATDEIKNISVQRDLDPHGNIISEKLSTGLTIQKAYDAFDRPFSITLPDQSQILYTYDPLFLRTILRVSSSGDVLYKHEYVDYDSSGYLLEEKFICDLGRGKHTTDTKGRKTSIASPYFKESCCYDEIDNTLEITTNDNKVHNDYDELDQLKTEGENAYIYDTNFNRIKENGAAWISNELDELLSTVEIQCTYDLNGNLLSKKTPIETMTFAYDPLDRLIQIVTNKKQIDMVYDPLGRRLCKTVEEITRSAKTIENYLYDGENDIGAFTLEGLTLQLRVPGLAYCKDSTATIAIELEGHIFAPLQDFQRNIRYLICTSTGKKIAEYHFNAFGKPKIVNEEIFNPWRYASKRFDQETNLIYFGKRYYDAD
ncbi:MAG TPA: hypothetical protein VGP47_04740, partial [Parachlamydiaceae bacterium]|nr:hypothetical protein [Parachlamydiaceae bacterium]